MADPDPTVPASPSLTRRRRTFLAPLWLFALGGVAILIALFAYWRSTTTTTVVLVRHAEKQVNADGDAPLSQEGEIRAARLARMFGDVSPFGRIQRIYVTDTRRAQQTAAALAQRLDLAPDIVPARSSNQELARRVLRENRGGRALIVGHSNTVPVIVSALAGGADVPEMSEDEFDTVYIVTVPTIGRPSVLRLKY